MVIPSALEILTTGFVKGGNPAKLTLIPAVPSNKDVVGTAETLLKGLSLLIVNVVATV